MTTSGTYNYNPPLGQLVLYAYNLCGIRPTSLLQEHFEAARMASNLVCGDFSNKGVNLWQVVLINTPLVAGVSTYSVNPNTVVILDGYISVVNGSQTIDRLILPISRTEYASYANKEQTGYPTVFWNDRLLSPTVTLWPVPNGQQASFNYYALTQTQDAVLANGTSIDVPYLWMKAFAYALAVELAVIWAPDKLAIISPLADRAYESAATTNVETAQQYISPIVSGYFRP